MRGYLFAVKKRPVVFIEMACRAFVSAEVEGHDSAFRPTSAELAAQTKAQMERYLAEQYWLKMILTARIARVISEADRQLTTQKMAAFAEEQKAREEERQKTEREARARSLAKWSGLGNDELRDREWEKRGLTPPPGIKISHALAAALGAVPERDDKPEKMVL